MALGTQLTTATCLIAGTLLLGPGLAQAAPESKDPHNAVEGSLQGPTCEDPEASLVSVCTNRPVDGR
ncbi:hypothetical protein [Pseudonocardia spinosispora]|uniref:hypothetical protein n=1 Tax=Pseudonocardia spinosispora TaxID=103441 RepID=UPI0004010A4A|nr:hypothetical protein [Pseudonocardia spinosispora]